MNINDDVINTMIEMYKDNHDEIEFLRRFIDRYGCLNDGALNVNSTFEMGYNNALERVFNLLGITIPYNN